jgi:predicted transposase/invertase (TIGR01784 family)
MRPVFADPKTDFVFKRIFGSEPHKHLLIELLNALLELDGEHRIVDLTYLPAEQITRLPEMKLSIVDVKCRDQRDTEYVVEMQLLNVEGFEERVVYNASKAFVMQLRTSEDYPRLNDVVGVTICDFSLWSEPGKEGRPVVPMLSRWRMQEQHCGARGLPQVQYVFLELPKYAGGGQPRTLLDKWTYFFREAENLTVIPPELDEEPFREAFEVARMARFTDIELEAYDQAKMAEQDARGALVMAHQEGLEQGVKQGLEQGRKEGLEQGLRRAIESLCHLLAIEITGDRRAFLAAASTEELERLLARLSQEKRWD